MIKYQTVCDVIDLGTYMLVIRLDNFKSDIYPSVDRFYGYIMAEYKI